VSRANDCIDPDLRSRLAAYEFGLLPESEKAGFETHLAGCDACREDLWDMAPWMAELTGSAQELQRRLAVEPVAVEPMAVEPMAGEPKPPGETWWDAVRRWLSPPVAVPLAAAALVLVVFVWRTSVDDGVVSLAQVDPVPWSALDVRAGDAPAASRRFRQGMEEYGDERWDRAIVELEAAIEEGARIDGWKDAEDAHFFLGLCLLLERRPDEALPHLQRAAGSPLLPLADRARWYEAQAHLLRNDPEPARSRLVELTGSPVWGAQAAEQLSRLR